MLMETQLIVATAEFRPSKFALRKSNLPGDVLSIKHEISIMGVRSIVDWEMDLMDKSAI